MIHARSAPQRAATDLGGPPLRDHSLLNRRIEDLHLDPMNPRIHAPKQVRKIAKSIEAFGFNVPILIDHDCQVIAGHGRLLAAKGLGLTEVPTIMLEHLTEAQAKAFMIADNRLTETSAWDDQLLAEQLKALSMLNLDFSLEVTGFDMGEIDFRVEGLEETPDGGGKGGDPGDVLPEPVEGKPVTALGDLWCLGPHRVLCGDALSEEAFSALMADQKAAVVFSDPPYNVPITGHVTGNGAIQHREFPMACGEMSEKEFTTFLTAVMKNLARHGRDGSLHYICMDWRHLREVLEAGEQAYSELKNLCVWAKDKAGMGSFYRSQHELVLVFKSGKGAHQNHVQLGQFGRYRTNVWNYPGVSTFGRQSEEGNLLALHPTVKPINMVADVLLDASCRGELVLDAFLGSGTTLMAAERVGRVCYGLELDPIYVDTVIRRWQAWTGEHAVLSSTGESFDALQAACAKVEAVNVQCA